LIRPLKLIRNIIELYKPEELKIDEQLIVNDEIKELNSLFDKKKNIAIPKIEQEKKENVDLSITKANTKENKDVNVNNNNQKEIQSASTADTSNTSSVKDVNQSLFIRPNTYIVYGELQRNDNKFKIKEYEASQKEIEYLKKIDSSKISIENYEKAIVALENDVEKGEMIPKERAIEVLRKEFPEKDNEFYDRIYEYWMVRREIFKKSLLRRYWKDQKYTDKYLETTFRRRDKEKMKTRKNKSQHDECLKKIYEMKVNSQKYLPEMISNLMRKERIKRLAYQIKNIEFELKVVSNKQEKSRLELRLKDLYKQYEIKDKPPKSIQVLLYDNKNDGFGNGYGHGHGGVYQNSQQEQTMPVGKGVFNNQVANAQLERISTSHKEESKNEEKQTLSMKMTTNKEMKKDNPNRRQYKDKKHQVHSCLGQLDSQMNEMRKRQKEDKEKRRFLRYRLRMDQRGNIIVDRYIQSSNSFNPFDDDFNRLIVNEQANKPVQRLCLNEKSQQNDFSEHYVDYLKGVYNEYPDYSDDDEEVNEDCIELRSFSNSYRQYLKNKRILVE